MKGGRERERPGAGLRSKEGGDLTETRRKKRETPLEHFVDKHQCDLIARVCNIGPILDNLFREGVIQQEDYDTIRTIPTTQERMRKLYSGSLKAGGQAAKDVFFRILKKEESYLVADLNRKES
ncbi:apoptosis-associated speck-like protein containing a CARD [Sparus aurata]|uniref:apoptosis-associated speck-like protein containing a CARD n=1 Tax=Sparus aurata TaxID=8175 RepID=UPI0011C0E206|nr:apoptosis-associated speck-like protein containing a CARD [Sparus aurata]